MASAIYGEARATRDVDLIAALLPPQARPFVTALGTGFYADIAAIESAVAVVFSTTRLSLKEITARVGLGEFPGVLTRRRMGGCVSRSPPPTPRPVQPRNLGRENSKQ